MCTCGTEVETTEYSLWCCRLDSTQKIELFENLEKVDLNFLSLNAKNQALIFFMVLKQIIPKVSIKKFLKISYDTLKHLHVLVDHYLKFLANKNYFCFILQIIIL